MNFPKSEFFVRFSYEFSETRIFAAMSVCRHVCSVLYNSKDDGDDGIDHCLPRLGRRERGRRCLLQPAAAQQVFPGTDAVPPHDDLCRTIQRGVPPSVKLLFAAWRDALVFGGEILQGISLFAGAACRGGRQVGAIL